MDDIRNHKFIICGGDGLNPLGIIRSLGEEGLHPYVITKKLKKERSIIATSKYVEHVLYTNSDEGVIETLINVFGHEFYKPFVFLTDEGHAELLDRRYDEIDGKFFFFQCRPKGTIN